MIEWQKKKLKIYLWNPDWIVTDFKSPEVIKGCATAYKVKAAMIFVQAGFVSCFF